MRELLKGCLFVAAFFVVPVFTLDEDLTLGNVFWFCILFGACALLMWRFDMFDLPDNLRYEKKKK